MESWPRVDLNAPVGSLVGKKIAVGGIGPEGANTVVYVLVLRRPFGVKVGISDTTKRTTVAGAASPTVEPSMTLGEVILAHADVRPSTAAELPNLTWRLGSHPQTGFVWALLIIAALVWAVILREPIVAQWTVPLIVGYVTLKLRGRTQSDRRAVDRANVVADGRTILPGEVYHRLPPSAVDPEAETLTPTDRVTLVREAYGKLKTDIAYRIENSALFDGASPATQRFEIALIAWDPASPDAASLATEVEESFDAAREAAEEEGFGHLPEPARDTARRAHGATAMAVAAANPAERLAAATKAADLLRSLALYYLPTLDPAAPQLLATPKEIEPAP